VLFIGESQKESTTASMPIPFIIIIFYTPGSKVLLLLLLFFLKPTSTKPQAEKLG